MKGLIGVLVVLGLAAPAHAKRMIVGFKAGTPAAVRAKVLGRLGATQLESIKSNGHTSDEFEAVVVEASNDQKKSSRGYVLDVLSSVLGDDASAAEEDVIVEEDFRTKWIESSAVSFQGTPLPAFESVMGALPKVEASRRGLAGMAAMGVAPMAIRVGGNDIPWGVQRVKAPAAWDTTEGKGAVVAVIDTGVRSDHPRLSGQVVGGYNAIDDTESLGSYEDDNGHGTHVAGTIAAKRDGRGVVGVAPQAKIVAVKALDADGSGSLSDVIQAIIWCVNNNIQLINMSLGSAMDSELMHRAVRYAKARGVVIIAAAGNSGGDVSFPGAYPEVIGVAASDYADKMAKFSSRGPQIQFIAPGVDIVSAWVTGNTVSLSGTSMASPHVAGLAALAFSQGARGLGGPDGISHALSRASSCLLPKEAPKPAGKKLVKTDAGDSGCYKMIDGGRLVQ